MTVDVNSIANANAVSVSNVVFQTEALNLPRKILIIATYDPLKTAIVDEVPFQVFSPEDSGDKTGYGFMAHRLTVQAFAGARGIPVWISPQAEPTGAQSAGDITFVTGTTVAGTINLFIAGLAVPFTIAAGDDQTEVATKCVAAITAIKELPVTATNTLGVVDIIAKTEGTFGDEISILFNLNAGQVFPDGITSAVITAMTGGTGTPAIADALDGLGTGDDANEAFFTDVVHGYLQDSTSLDAISAYVGEGNTETGLYAKTVARPFRVLTGDTDPGSAALTALIAVGDGRKNDRANGIIAVPDSPNHPSEIAALAIGNMARINNNRAAESYGGIVLAGIFPGDKADRWTSEYSDRDLAAKAGISPTKIESGTVVMQNVRTFYHPDSVPVSSNGYASMRNISILQNIENAVKATFAQEKWQGITIVEDVTNVSNVVDRTKVRDIDAVIDELTVLATAFAGKGLIYTANFTIEQLGIAGAVTVRSGGNGFNSTFKIILSGEGGIIDTLIEFDTSIAVVTN